MKNSYKKVAAIASIATIATAAAGVYFLTGKNAKNRKKITKWASNIQKDVVNELEKAGKHSKASYEKIVDKVINNYKGIKEASATDLSLLAAEIKGYWDAIKNETVHSAKNIKKIIPKSVKSAKSKVAVKKTTVKPKPVKKSKRK